jgi:hypothetical protein
MIKFGRVVLEWSLFGKRILNKIRSGHRGCYWDEWGIQRRGEEVWERKGKKTKLTMKELRKV